jgi:Domain of unknown function (DUF4864)/zinc-ribbon domain
MFCSQCGAKIDPTSRFCPACGAQIQSSSELDLFSKTLVSSSTQPTNQEPAPAAPVVKKRRMPLWFKIISFLAVLALIGVTAGILFTESLVDVVDNQLNALRANDASKAYYAYTSKAFQNSTSLDEFRQFVQTYPIFSENQSAHFTQRSIKDHVGILKGNLTSKDHVNTPVEFKLIKEGDKWKILSVRLLKPNLRIPTKETTQPDDLLNLAKMQLKDIQDNKLKEAYENYTAKEFRDTTSLEDFDIFIKRYPILTNYQTISFLQPIIRQGGVGTLAAILHSDQLAANVKYYFIYEDAGWKIWSLRISAPSKFNDNTSFSDSATHENQMNLGSVVFGNQTDEQGLISEPKTKFSKDLENLYIEISVHNGLKEQLVNLNLQQQDNGLSIPAQAMIEENGDSLLISEFTPPSGGWPSGIYKLIVTTSSGLNQVATFEID